MSEGNLGWDYWEENRGWENEAKSFRGSNAVYLAIAGGIAAGATALFLTRNSWMIRTDDEVKRDVIRTYPKDKSISPTTKAEHRGYRDCDIPAVLKSASKAGVFGLNSQPVAVFYDLDAQKETLLALQSAFPSHFFHTFAVKANPLPFVLKAAVELGMGLEAASYCEMIHSVRQGCPPGRIVFDSPAKTVFEIEEAIKLGVRLNADNLDEVDRIAQILAKKGLPQDDSLHVGLRVNPLVGAGSIAALSVSDGRSKFGVELSETTREAVIESFLRYEFLEGLHVHVGSQGCSMQQLAEGARIIVELADEIDRRQGRNRIKYVDIGGGLPVNFKSGAVSPTFADYAQHLQRVVPSLWENSRRTVITEYGRTVCAKAGWVACSVEYVKPLQGGDRVAIVQAGADLFVRSCYAQSSFPLRLTAHNGATGEPLPATRGDSAAVPRYDVAGPLCFGGDKLAVEVELGQVEAGDVVVVHDGGANTLALWSRHCSRQAPPVYGYTREGECGGVEVRELKAAERVEDVLHFWDPAPRPPPLPRLLAALRRAVAHWLHTLAGPACRV